MLPVLTSQIAVILMFRFLFALIFLFVSVGGHAQAPEKTRVSGALEHWSLDEPSSKLSLTGWVLAGQDGTAPPAMKLSILGTEFQAKDAAWTARPELSADSPYTGGQVGVGFDWDGDITCEASWRCACHPA